MADLFVSIVAIAPKPSQAATQQPLITSSDGQDIGGKFSDIKTNQVATPGGQSK